MKKNVSIVWSGCCPAGTISVKNGCVSLLGVISGEGKTNGPSFSFRSGAECRLALAVDNAELENGAGATLVHVRTAENSFSFFLRDICAQYPVYIPQYGVIVTTAEDSRPYGEISSAVESRAVLSRLEAIENGPEESFDSAAASTRNLQGVTWLGLSRDIRIFEAGFRGITYTGPNREVWDWIKPRYHGYGVNLPELGDTPVRYDYFAGRGLGCEQALERRLEEGCLPILNSRHTDEDVCYVSKTFVTNEKSPLAMEHIPGTHYLVADEYSHCSMMTEEQKKLKDSLLKGEIERDEETVAYIRIEAVNTAKVPRYSWVRLPQPNVHSIPELTAVKPEYDGTKGFGSFSRDRVFLVATLNGKPVPQQEMAILLKPGEKAVYVFKIPHVPVSEARADALMRQDYDARLSECRDFWSKKLEDAAKFSIPEKRVDEMMKAGILHFDLVCYGREPDGAVAPVVGHYSPIGSESSPIIQYLESIGKNDLARRSIMYFFEKQQDDGFMQNFGGYMLETGAVLWNVGEHYRYTGDKEWVEAIKDKIIKACDYLIAWRQRNQTEELRGKGYGMIEGKVADPEDPFHSYMLNGFACLGLKRSAEVLAAVGNGEAGRIGEAAKALLADIRTALAGSLADAPVIPLGNGRWCPSVSPWVENVGPLSLYADAGNCFTHATFTTRDAIIGTVYLLLQEVVDPREPYGDFILNSTTELFYLRNTVFSQPYYSPHPYANLKRGEVKAFLKEFYSGVSALADRETYTFWEHFYHVSPHKTHEEGWFLMRCRWMLYMEDAESLNLLPGVPRAWMEDGKKISIKGMKTYFGDLHLEVESAVERNEVSVSLRIDPKASRLPETVRIRLPHPQMRKASESGAGIYDSGTETVIITGFNGSADFIVRF